MQNSTYHVSLHLALLWFSAFKAKQVQWMASLVGKFEIFWSLIWRHKWSIRILALNWNTTSPSYSNTIANLWPKLCEIIFMEASIKSSLWLKNTIFGHNFEVFFFLFYLSVFVTLFFYFILMWKLWMNFLRIGRANFWSLIWRHK